MTQKQVAHKPEVGRIVGVEIFLFFEVHAWLDDVELFRRTPLDLLQEVCVDTQLQDGSAFRFLSQLGIADIVILHAQL